MLGERSIQEPAEYYDAAVRVMLIVLGGLEQSSTLRLVERLLLRVMG